MQCSLDLSVFILSSSLSSESRSHPTTLCQPPAQPPAQSEQIPLLHLLTPLIIKPEAGCVHPELARVSVPDLGNGILSKTVTVVGLKRENPGPDGETWVTS